MRFKLLVSFLYRNYKIDEEKQKFIDAQIGQKSQTLLGLSLLVFIFFVICFGLYFVYYIVFHIDKFFVPIVLSYMIAGRLFAYLLVFFLFSKPIDSFQSSFYVTCFICFISFSSCLYFFYFFPTFL
jgi:hypothetical protein